MADLEREKFNYFKERQDKLDAANLYLLERNIDSSYLKLTVIIVILVILVYYLSCGFGFGRPQPKQLVIPGAPGPVLSPEEAKKTAINSNDGTGVKISQAPRENFSPYVSTSLPDLYRSDASFDNSIQHGRSESRLESIIDGVNDKNYSRREDYLFDQTHALIEAYTLR